jgi:hypothetical protein
MKPALIPLPISQRENLRTLLQRIIEEDTFHIQQLQEFRKTNPYLKQNLAEYIVVGNLEGGYCYPSLTTDLPSWLSQFLLQCYVTAHNSLAQKEK